MTYQINPAHSGNISGDTLTPPLTKQWSRTDLGGLVSYPLIAGGKVFVTVQGPYTSSTGSYPPKWIDALDESTGATIWSQPISGTYGFVAAAYDNGTVFVLNEDGLLKSFNADTGAAGWTSQMQGQYSFTSPPTASNGVVFVLGSGSGGTLYAVNETDGTTLWQKSGLDAGDNSSPTLSSSGVYVSGSCDVYGFALSPTPGTNPQLWDRNYGCDGGGGKTAVLGPNGLYVRQMGVPSSNDVLDPATGAVGGHFTAGTAPAFSGSTGFFMTSTMTSPGTLYAIDSSGNQLWSFSGDGNLDSAPIVINNDVYVGSSAGTIYAVDTTTGTNVWSANVGAAIPAPDEQNANIKTGLGAGEGHLVVPAGTTLTAFAASSPDTTPPVITSSVTGTSGTNGWYVGPVNVSWSVSDPETGITSSSGCGSTTLTADTSGTTLTCSATDGQGLTSSSSVTVKIDRIAPVVSCSAPPMAWSASDISLSCTASDTGSGVATADGSFTLSTSVASGTETDNASTPSRTVCDLASNCSTVGPYSGLKVDKKAPSISLSVPTSTTYTINQSVLASYACSDGGSGVASCSAPVASGAPIPTGSVGSKAFTVSAADVVGNLATPQQVGYTVTYGVCSVSTPTIKSGHTGSVSVQLCDAGSKNLSSPSIALTATGIYTSGGSRVQTLSNLFSFSSSLNGAGGGYTDKISTTGLAAGTYYVGFTATGDPVSHQASFAVK